MTVHNSINSIGRSTPLPHNLDTDGNSSLPIDVSPLLVVPDARAFVACNYKPGLAVSVWRRARWKDAWRFPSRRRHHGHNGSRFLLHKRPDVTGERSRA